MLTQKTRDYMVNRTVGDMLKYRTGQQFYVVVPSGTHYVFGEKVIAVTDAQRGIMETPYIKVQSPKGTTSFFHTTRIVPVDVIDNP